MSPAARPIRFTILDSMRSSIRRLAKPPVSYAIHRSIPNTPLNPMSHLSGGLRIERLSALNLESLQDLIGLVLPVRYDSGFYAEALTNAAYTALCKRIDAAFWSSISFLPYFKVVEVMVAVSERFLREKRIREEYRRRGIASALLNDIIASARRGERRRQRPLRLVLHVHVANDGAIRLYAKHGFTMVRRVSGYYAQNVGVSEPRDALLLELLVE
ncbi:hypothetical protein HDU83_000094 [Entophlyctis luteolus]|nr:hypothetical protein HDU83_000094 [Entophlyctis luteolus]